MVYNNRAIAFYDLTYDAGSRITKIIDVDGTNDFGYDTRNQLLDATHSDVDNENETYSYDDNGNRTIDGYITGINNKLLSDGVYNYDYDNEGNLISQTTIATAEVRLFEWDYLNRLVGITDFDSSDNNVLQTVEFSYDMMGRRLSKVVDGVGIYFVYDRDDVILDFVDDGGGVELDMRYLHGNQVDQVLAQDDRDGNVTWLLTDHLGSISDLVDNSGTVVNHLTYDSYGNVISETDSTVDSRYRFTGREWDEEIDLYYYRARYYNGDTGRFISIDPISFDSGTYNLYGYVDNNPVSNVDPFGLLVVATYNRKTQVLMIVDLNQNNPPVIIKNLFSGNGDARNKPELEHLKEVGPIPQGTYDILDDPLHPGWFRLDRVDSQPINDRDDDLYGRDGFRLHPGSRSNGCVTVPEENSEDWKMIKNIIRNTDYEQIVTSQVGRLSWLRNLFGKSQKIKRYGILIVE